MELEATYSFSEALNALKEGKKIARQGWNGKGAFIFLNPSSDVIVTEGRPLNAAFAAGTPIHCSEYLMMKTPTREGQSETVIPYPISTWDILNNDWVILEN